MLLRSSLWKEKIRQKWAEGEVKKWCSVNGSCSQPCGKFWKSTDPSEVSGVEARGQGLYTAWQAVIQDSLSWKGGMTLANQLERFNSQSGLAAKICCQGHYQQLQQLIFYFWSGSVGVLGDAEEEPHILLTLFWRPIIEWKRTRFHFLLESKYHETPKWWGVQRNGSRLTGSTVQLYLPCVNYLGRGGPLYMNALKMLKRQGEEVHSCDKCDWKSSSGDKNVSGEAANWIIPLSFILEDDTSCGDHDASWVPAKMDAWPPVLSTPCTHEDCSLICGFGHDLQSLSLPATYS